MGDPEYQAAWRRVVVPVAKEFDPDLILFSAGFYACEGDAIGQYAVTPACFASMVAQLMFFADKAETPIRWQGCYAHFRHQRRRNEKGFGCGARLLHHAPRGHGCFRGRSALESAMGVLHIA